MATVELRPGEEFDFNGVHIHGEFDEGQVRNYAYLGSWIRREFDLDISIVGGNVDYLEYLDVAPIEENELILAAIANFARQKAPEVIGERIITVRDPDDNLL